MKRRHHKSKTPQPKHRRRRTTAVCRDCEAKQQIDRYLFYRPSPPRCPKCGAMLDYKGILPRRAHPKKPR